MLTLTLIEHGLVCFGIDELMQEIEVPRIEVFLGMVSISETGDL